MSNKANVISSTRENIKKKKDNNHTKKFSYIHAKFPLFSKKKFNNNNNEVKKTDMVELNQNNQKTNDVNIYLNHSNKKQKICPICGEVLLKSDIKINKLKCKHLFCTDCFFNYLKEKINNNQFLQITCPEKDCEEIIGNNMIIKILINEKNLLEKYNKLVKRNQLMLDPNIQLCPFPDCESYAKKGKSKYVKCIENKHKFCFNCLKDWHNNIPCKDSSLSNSLNALEFSNKVKRCPKCKFFIEKGEGCNHMTCSNCKYQFCWLCMGEYEANHFDRGRCDGLQYAREMPSKCKIFLNAVIIRFLFITLKSLLFGIVSPFCIIAYIYYKIYRCWRREEFWTYVFCISGVLACLTFSAPLFMISNFIAILMFFIWPLNDKIIDSI